MKPNDTQPIPLYPQCFTRKLLAGRLTAPLQDYNYLVICNKYPDGKVMSFKTAWRLARRFDMTDMATAELIQMCKDTTQSQKESV